MNMLRTARPSLLLRGAAVAAIALMPMTVMLTDAGPARADDLSPVTGSFRVADAPVYASVDNALVQCLFGGCSTVRDTSADSTPVWRSDHAGAAVYISCRLGGDYKVAYLDSDPAAPETGFTPVGDVRAWDPVRDCNPLDVL